jgi:hypothetical protein
MVSSSKAPDHFPPLTVAQTSIAALERLRESYKGPLARPALTEADQAVLMVVEMTLKQVRNARQPA